MPSVCLRDGGKTRPAPAARKIWIQPPLLGTNGVGVTALPHVTNCSVVWKFAQNQDGAKQFVADLIDSSRTGYAASLGINFPIYPKTVPDLIVRLTKDPQADPGFKYTLLKDALHWTPNLGVPGFATPAYMEVFNSFLIPKMVQSVLKEREQPGGCRRGGSGRNRAHCRQVETNQLSEAKHQPMQFCKQLSALLLFMLLSLQLAVPAPLPRTSPEFSINPPVGKSTLLSSLKGKVVVMEFLFVKSQHC